MISLPVLSSVRALAGGRAPTWFRSEMTSRASSVVRVPAAASWLRRFQRSDLRLSGGPLLGTTLEQLMGQIEASPSQGQTEADTLLGSSDAMTRLNSVTLPANRSLAAGRRSITARLARTSGGVVDAVSAERVASRASIGDLQKWAAAPLGGTATRPRTAHSRKAASPTASSTGGKGSSPQLTASFRNRLTVPALPPEAEAAHYWSDSTRGRGDAFKESLAAAGASFEDVLTRPAGTTETANASVIAAQFGKTVITGCASEALLARCLRYGGSAARPKATRHRGTTRTDSVSQWPLSSDADGLRDAAETPGKSNEPVALGSAGAERQRANATWADPPLESSDYSITPYSGAPIGMGGVVAADAPLTEPVAALRGFEPSRIVAPRLIKGRAPEYGTARVQAESEPGDENLSVLAEQIKKILDEEARRHGIPV
jgi:hypothetical protein